MITVGRFSPAAQAVCPLWGAKPAWFCSQYQVWEDSGCCLTSARDTTHSCLISAWRKHKCTTTSAYKAWVGPISCWCGIAPRVFPYLILRTKPCGLGSPGRTNNLCGGWKISPQKGAFEGNAHQEYCLLWGGIGWPYLTPLRFCYPEGHASPLRIACAIVRSQV